MLRRALAVVVVLAAVQCFAQQGVGNNCTLAGTWYGGSVVAYQMTIVPSVPAGHYTLFYDGIFKATPIAAMGTGRLVKHGKVYEGSSLSLVGDDSFINMPPGANGKMPDVEAVWASMEMVDCNTMRSTVWFFGTYFAANIWEPGIVWKAGKPLVDPPDIDWINILNNGHPIVETYHRLPNKVNPDLVHKN